MCWKRVSEFIGNGRITDDDMKGIKVRPQEVSFDFMGDNIPLNTLDAIREYQEDAVDFMRESETF